ncbi:flagellar hook-basal body complex protein FlhO [Paenibacillus antibioticophila]|uniref:Flagellar hook-basal body complex protein FlhO n=1 Tax=Paenibacillus antibioticophila TaxID=1274374 RepID=A0A919XRQ0_9BACL|nr:flagellar hook-basal body protein [Paenibacillus antibioticophila]GIO35240.1 flagellar hook-basal body complex protein FlhO [Paenibacillus antibioticophila]
MLRGLYTAASGMITQQRRHDTVTQNIANINTAGYKQVNSVTHSFPDVLISLMGDKENGGQKTIGRLTTGVFAEESLASFMQGDLKETNNSSDFGLVSNLVLIDPATDEPIPFDASGKYVAEDGEVIYRPEVFFTVQDANGETRYTRDGGFRVNAVGDLLTDQGQRVLDTDGNPIALPPGITMDQVKSDSLGNLSYDVDGVQTDLAAIGVVVVNNPHQLVREGHGVFRVDNVQAADIRALEAEDNASVRQGYLESSNVDTAQAMVDLMAAQRAYESNQKLIQYYDKSLEKAVNEIGRV